MTKTYPSSPFTVSAATPYHASTSTRRLSAEQLLQLADAPQRIERRGNINTAQWTRRAYQNDCAPRITPGLDGISVSRIKLLAASVSSL